MADALESSRQPFELLSCTWPFPLSGESFEPKWDAALTHLRPVPKRNSNGNDSFCTLDWGELFRGGDRYLGNMRQFGVVFRIRVNATGKLMFKSESCCAIKRGNACLFAGVPYSGVSVDAIAGDLLDIAVAHGDQSWVWGAKIEPVASGGADLVSTYLPLVQARLRQPNGPPIKIFTDARHPIRTVIAIYSMILNGYSPSKVYIYGDHQWGSSVRYQLALFLPFATCVPSSRIYQQISQLASSRLIDAAKNFPMVMKACITLLCDPVDLFCMMDDDIFVLRTVADAQALFEQNDFVFARDIDNAATYRPIWGDIFGDISLTRTSRQNGSLCWMRMRKDRKAISDVMVRGLSKLEGLPTTWSAWSWEQGLVAYLFAKDLCAELPAQSYWYPYFNGLPGGMLGYDYANNPCGFTTIHFGGDVPKPDDNDALQLMPQILGGRRSSSSVQGTPRPV